jgi:hypothetical protein
MHDRELFADRDFNGVINIMRKGRRCNWMTVGSKKWGVIVDSAHHVFALTDNWSSRGKVCDWGIEPICNRLRAMDLWNNEAFMEEFMKENEKVDMGQERDRLNSMESFLYDFRDTFKKTFNDVNTTNMVK